MVGMTKRKQTKQDKQNKTERRKTNKQTNKQSNSRQTNEPNKTKQKGLCKLTPTEMLPNVNTLFWLCTTIKFMHVKLLSVWGVYNTNVCKSKASQLGVLPHRPL